MQKEYPCWSIRAGSFFKATAGPCKLCVDDSDCDDGYLYSKQYRSSQENCERHQIGGMKSEGLLKRVEGNNR